MSDQMTSDFISIILVYRIRGEQFNDLWELTLQSINGILQTADFPFELIVIDNGSHDLRYSQALNTSAALWDDMPFYRRWLVGFRQLRFEQHTSLAKVWNEGARQADGAYIMLANNDIVYHETGWMSRMVEPFGWDEKQRSDHFVSKPVGIVGIQHMSWHAFAFVEGSLFVFPERFRQQFDIGGDDQPPTLFDEQFVIACEDVDFNHRVQQADYAVIQVNNPPLQPRYLQHLGHRTIHTLIGTDEDYIEESHRSRLALCAKWGVEPRIND